ncbi:hypothetical protein KP509_38G038400 [Ceratopteris richardii]|uniref:Signal recognition particle subunit SRP68 n=1 Tax=Ceratopteris richardii TaxID=49495 RepID=A0A8T2Q3Y2_CERRI|nr:hypothetical protein KP509_38G038400 [Ceratopteris richardii]
MGVMDASTNVSLMEIEPKETKYAFNVLQLIKTAQNEHGVRHHDYTRYRRYCTARLRRLYKSLKFTHGRGKYVRKQIVVANITDVRFLHILLYSAERAWSYAMAIKQTLTGPSSRQRFHLATRLSKAVKWADLFSHACAEKADPKTSLEATAYAAYMKGSYLVEREQHWDMALKNFESARVIYEELGKYGSVENQVLCRQRVEDEIDPNIRYCSYKMGHSNMDGAELLKLSVEDGPALDLLKAKLEAVLSEARSQQTASLTELEWLGRKFSVDNAKIRASIIKGQQLEKDLGESVATLPLEKRVNVFDKIFSAYQDARRHIREDMVSAGSSDGVKDNLNGLDKAVSCILLQQTMKRNQLLVTMYKNRISKQQQHPSKDEKGDKSVKPQELVRLYDLLIENLTDLIELVTSGRMQNDEETMYAAELAAKKIIFQAQRCFYLGHVHLAGAKYAQSYLLYKRAHDYSETGLREYQQLKTQPQGKASSEYEELIRELEKLLEECRVHSCLVHALGISEVSKTEFSLRSGVANIKLDSDNPSKKKASFLLERTDIYEAAVALLGSKNPPQIMQLPPAFQAVSCKPIVLDTAVNTIDFPSLDAHLKKEEKKKSFFGLWRS